METDRLAAFSDGVIAIIITIMVLELKTPQGVDIAALSALAPLFLSYVLSFIYVAIYWNNHHHLLFTVQHVNGTILWANTHLLFWLSLIPLATAWVGEHVHAPLPTALYGVVLLGAAIAYYILQRAILGSQQEHSVLARALGRDLKGKLSPVLYVLAIGMAGFNPLFADSLYIGVALLWLIPDRRIESALTHTQKANGTKESAGP